MDYPYVILVTSYRTTFIHRLAKTEEEGRKLLIETRDKFEHPGVDFYLLKQIDKIHVPHEIDPRDEEHDTTV